MTGRLEYLFFVSHIFPNLFADKEKGNGERPRLLRFVQVACCEGGKITVADGRVGIERMRRNRIISWDLVSVHGRVNQNSG